MSAEMYECEMCGGDLMELGQLGETVHYRCRACGWDVSYPHDPFEDCDTPSYPSFDEYMTEKLGHPEYVGGEE